MWIRKKKKEEIKNILENIEFDLAFIEFAQKKERIKIVNEISALTLKIRELL